MFSKKSPNTNIRYAALAVSFCVICLAFSIVLAVVLIKGPQTEYEKDDGLITRTLTVAGLRGQIYDRNGKLLVGNSTTYDLIFEYGAMSDTYAEINNALLDTLEALSITKNEDKLSDDYFPLDGIYPNMYYSPAASDPNSNESFYLARLLSRAELDADISADDLIARFIKKYKIDTDEYSSEEITSLLRLWYEMERIGFGAYQHYTVARGVSVELVSYAEEKGIEGVNFLTVSERVYHYPGIASHILGRLGKISAETAEYYNELGYPMDAYVGTSGCELAFESILHGQDGTLVIKYDDEGNVVKKYYETEPISGNDVYLTIDIDLQIAAEQGLAEAAEASKTGEAGAITAMDPNTGAVLAIASHPTYDLSQFSSIAYYNSLLEDPNNPLLNRALSGVYAPGSTYKLGVALAALEEGQINTSTTYTCSGVYPHLHRPECLGIHGSTNIYEAIQESCNVFFYNIGHSMGIEAITAYTEKMGLGVSTGIELPEKTGSIAGPQNAAIWSAGNDVSAAIGQSDHGYTPLQLSVYTSTLVNGGKRFSAHLLDSVRSFSKAEPLMSYSPNVLNTVSISDSSYNILMSAAGMVVSNNDEISQYFTNVPVAVGGKTGTAEVSGQLDNALFTGFAPLNEPTIVVSCIIEEGLHGYLASIAVARVMEEYFSAEE